MVGHFLVLVLCHRISSTFPGEGLILSLVDYLNIHHVILIKYDDADSYHAQLQSRKTLSRHLYTSTLSLADLPSVMSTAGVVRSLVVLRGDDPGYNISDLVQMSVTMDISPLSWLLLTDAFDSNEYRDIAIPFGCEFVVAAGSDAAGRYDLTEVYDTLTVDNIQRHLGTWSRVGGLSASDHGFFARRRDLEGTIFNVSSNHEEPCSIQSFAVEAGSVAKCLHWNLFVIFADMYNFSINWIVLNRPVAFAYQALSPEIQLSIYEIIPISDMETTIIWPSFRIPIEIYTSYTGAALEWSTFIRPFNKEMWMAICVWFALSAALISAADFIARNLIAKTGKLLYLNLWLNYLFLSYSAFCNQSEGFDPDKLSQRIILFLIFLIPTALLPGYSAALTSFLAIKSQNAPFTNLEGLSKAKDYKLAFQATFNLSIFFDPNSNDTVIRDLFRDIIVPESERPVIEMDGLKKMCKEKYSYLCPRQTVEALPPACPFFKLDRPMFHVVTALPVATGSPYKPLIDVSMRHVSYTGVLTVEALRIFPQTLAFPIKSEEETDDVNAIIFENVIGIIVGFGCSILLSVVLFFGEVVYHRWSSYRAKVSVLGTTNKMY